MPRTDKNDMDSMLYILGQSTLFEEFSHAELRSIGSLLEPCIKKYPRGTVIIQHGTSADRVGIIISGVVSVGFLSADNVWQTIAMRTSGDFYGLVAHYSENHINQVDIKAESDITVLSFAFLPLLDNAVCRERITEAVVRVMVRNTDADIKRLRMLVLSTAQERIWAFFEIKRKEIGSDILPLRMTQNELAALLNIHRSTVSSELNRLQREGYIKILPNRVYQILRPLSAEK